MATTDRLECMYATFLARVRLSAQTSETGVVVRSEATKLYVGFIQGVLHLIVEDPSLSHPATVPWTNVGSVGWVEPPAVEFVMAPVKPKTAAKAKPEAA